MEAIARHDFIPGNEDELGFNRGDLLKVLCMEEDPAWYRAEKEGQEGFIPYNYIEMKDHSWYVPNCLRTDAEERLLEKGIDGNYVQPDGAVLVRRSETAPQEFSLSVKFHNNVQHFKVLRDNQGKYFLWVYKFDSLNQLVDYHRTTSISRNEHILLLNMVSSRQNTVRAMFDFNPQDPDELQFRVGDIIQVIGRDDPHWWRGKLGDKQGVFPINHVQVIQ